MHIVSSKKSFVMWSRNVFAALTISILFLTGACTSSNSQSSSASISKITGNVAVFLPSDGLTITNEKPLNKWNSLKTSLKKSLASAGFNTKKTTESSSSNPQDQAEAISNYVAHHKNKTATLIVAPALSTDSSTTQYGDYVTKASASNTANASSSSSSSDSETKSTSIAQLKDSLQKAQNAGMRVILISQHVKGFTPDVFVNMSSAHQIGILQARQLVSKLKLNSSTSKNPVSIEILLPSSSTTAFARDAFSGIWSVLGPYFRSGKAYSPSGLVDASTKSSDWVPLTIDSSSRDSVEAAMASRLEQSTSVTSQILSDASLEDIDGVLCMNDYTASGVIAALTDMGYEGSSTDINPKISIDDVMQNLRGNGPLSKSSVPAPQSTESSSNSNSSSSSSESDSTSSSDSTAKSDNTWPIITGYGAYTSNMQYIVNGKQWMTGLEDRLSYSTDVAQIAADFNNGLSLKQIDKQLTTIRLKKGKKETRTYGVLKEPLMTVSAQNLKRILIDTNYISAADASL